MKNSRSGSYMHPQQTLRALWGNRVCETRYNCKLWRRHIWEWEGVQSNVRGCEEEYMIYIFTLDSPRSRIQLLIFCMNILYKSEVYQEILVGNPSRFIHRRGTIERLTYINLARISLFLDPEEKQRYFQRLEPREESRSLHAYSGLVNHRESQPSSQGP